ncbi:hypothetical protein GCM10025876_27670 [Demequina litorisediminis]|uniref:oxoglutarate dehydrogenase (succinyl-transferring) n=1 Tax=Demequina litorisediminis TaxID=1849022 RepID=A0ABQ6IF96_9MICO|nr:hypothetical protein GCM10025876_27670 [Demequina litorisediminis]
MADVDPLSTRIRKHPDLDVQTHGLTLWDLDRTYATGDFGGKDRWKMREVLGRLRDAYCRTIGVEYMHIADRTQRAWLQDRLEVGYTKPSPKSTCGSCVGSTPRRPSRRSCRPSTWARSASPSREASR